MINYVEGDILLSESDLIVHGCNCSGGFGSGLAAQIAQKYPRVREHYLRKYKDIGWSLGDIQYVYVRDLCSNRWIVNAATQLNYGRDKEVVYVDYDAIRTCVEKVLLFAQREQYSVALPRIGAGLANGEWGIIEKSWSIYRPSMKKLT